MRSNHLPWIGAMIRRSSAMCDNAGLPIYECPHVHAGDSRKAGRQRSQISDSISTDTGSSGMRKEGTSKNAPEKFASRRVEWMTICRLDLRRFQNCCNMFSWLQVWQCWIRKTTTTSPTGPFFSRGKLRCGSRRPEPMPDWLS